jgi:hypothetical protein
MAVGELQALVEGQGWRDGGGLREHNAGSGREERQRWRQRVLMEAMTAVKIVRSPI